MALVISSPVKLAHDNYQTWVRQMERLLECEGLKIWLDKENRPDLENFLNWKNLNLSKIYQELLG